MIANLRSAVLGNVQTRPRVSAPYYKTHPGGVPTYMEPLEHSVKPLPTLPYIVGNTTYDPKLFTEGKESLGTAFLRNKMSSRRSILPTLSGSGEPSKTNPTVL